MNNTITVNMENLSDEEREQLISLVEKSNQSKPKKCQKIEKEKKVLLTDPITADEVKGISRSNSIDNYCSKIQILAECYQKIRETLNESDSCYCCIGNYMLTPSRSYYWTTPEDLEFVANSLESNGFKVEIYHDIFCSGKYIMIEWGEQK